MKHVLSLLGILCSILGCGQWSTARTIDLQEVGDPTQAVAADFDGDGDVDFASTSSAEGNLTWYENDGAGHWIAQHVLEENYNLYFVCAGDVNEDGLIDIITATAANQIPCFLNQGNGIFVEDTLLLTQFAGNRGIETADLNTDGHLDIVVANNHEILVFRGDGTGDWSIAESFYQTTDNVSMSGMKVADLDADGDFDVALEMYNANGQIYWMENDGMMGSTAHLVDAGSIVDFGLSDVDNDGDQEIWVADLYELKLFRLDGVVITMTNDYAARTITTMDVNSDGMQDLVVMGPQQQGFYLNQGGFAPLGPVHQIASLDIGLPWYLFSLDADDDGDEDFILLNRSVLRQDMYRNEGNGVFGRPEVITSVVPMPRGIFIEDLNSDGLPDVVALGSSTIMYYLNDPSGYLGDQVIVSALGIKRDGLAADIDMDGLMDILTVSDNSDRTRWYYGDSAGGFGQQGNLGYTASDHVVTIKLNNDDYPDLVLINNGGLNAYLSDSGSFVNIGGFVLQIDESFNSISALTTADIDMDGTQDLVAGSSGDGRFSWFHNDGGAVLGPQIDIATGMTGFDQVLITDVDGDGDPDVIFASSNSGQVAWSANDGTGTFNATTMITDLPGPITAVKFADLDLDGYQDLVLMDPDNARVIWQKNDGIGNFAPSIPIVTGLSLPRDMELADMDVDGDMDLICLTDSPSTLVWYENFLNSPFHINGTVFLDTDLDGYRDVTEQGLPWLSIDCSPTGSLTLTNDTGYYSIFADPGSYEVSLTVNPALWGLTTDSTMYHPTLSLINPESEANDFGITPLMDSARATLWLVADGSPCSIGHMQFLHLRNDGTTTLKGNLCYEMDQNFSLISSSPAPSSISGNTFCWTIDSLSVFEHRSILLKVVNPAENQPFVNNLSFIALDSSGQISFSDTVTFGSVVACSYDPNNKEVVPSGYGGYGAVDINTSHLDFTIHFQNVGTAPAEKVVIRDRIDQDLDPNSIQVLGYSHAPSAIHMEEDHDLVIEFDQIFLPDSGTDQAESQGYFTYRMNMSDPAVHMDVIENTAEIYFDYNVAVVTNTTRNTLVDCALFEPTLDETEPGLLTASDGEYFQWYLDGSPIIGADSSAFATTVHGDYTVAITSIYGCHKTVGPFDISLLSGGDPHDTSPFHLWPNPARNSITVKTDDPLSSSDHIYIIDSRGILCHQSNGTNTSSIVLSTSELSSGIYTLYVRNDKRVLHAMRFTVIRE